MTATPLRIRKAAVLGAGVMVAIARRHASAPDREQRIAFDFIDLYVERARAQGVTLTTAEIVKVLEVDIRLNAQGVLVWLDRHSR